MAPHKSNEMSLVLSSDAKPRLKWTQQLHQRFVDAVIQLGGAEKATPKSLMRVMGICGITLYHLKSHLQKYRLGRNQKSRSCHQIKQEDNEDNISIGAHEEIDESSQVAQALQMQMDVQKQLQEQIEVQRHLQLRIEAQGKYLQSVLKKAQETLLDYSCSSSEVKQVKAQIGQLVSMADSRCSGESSLTSSDGTKDDQNDGKHKRTENPIVLSLMEMHPVKDYNNIELDDQKRSKNGDRSSNLFDLNCECTQDFDSGIIDSNCNWDI